MASPIGRVSRRTALAVEVFQRITGYLVIATEGLDTTTVIDADMRLLEITPGLSDRHIEACIDDAYEVIGPDRVDDVISAQRLGLIDVWQTIRAS